MAYKQSDNYCRKSDVLRKAGALADSLNREAYILYIVLNSVIIEIHVRVV